jgi:hypothetical protein
MRKEVFEAVVNAVTNLKNTNNSPLFQKVYVNTIPVWTDILEHPAVALAYAEEVRERSAMCTNRFENVGTIMLYIYNKSEDYVDVMSPLIEAVLSVVETDTTIREETLDCYVAEWVKDLGSLHPHYMAELTLIVRFLERV